MHLKNPLLFGLMAILLLGGTITPAISQNSPDLGIVINEIEINPRGSDAGIGNSESGISSKSVEGYSGSQEYVELYNPTNNEIEISGWKITPTATWKSYTIPDNTFIQAKSFLAFTHVNYWFKDFGDSVSLYDDVGNLVDETPLLIDKNDDSSSWQRITDGLDTNSSSDWELVRMTPKSTNGSITVTEETTFSLFATVDNKNYVFGEIVTISGNISDTLLTKNSTPEIVKVKIQGPNYFKNLALFPDRELTFSTSLMLQKVLGFNEGNYDVTVSYGDNTQTLSFMIDSPSVSDSENIFVETLEIFTDKPSYLPGETAILFAETNSSIEYGGLDYTVTNPHGQTIFEGTIFPNSEFSTVFQAGGGQIFPFSTQLFISGVDPVYGTYDVNAVYKSQNIGFKTDLESKNAKTSFSVIEDVKEDVPISISTDKELYTVDEIIKVTGRSNDIWVEDFELFVKQTGLLTATSLKGSNQAYISPDPFDLRDRVRLNGDGTFEFEFKLIESFSPNEEYSKFYGDYKITVSEYFGDASVFFKVVENVDTFVDIRTPLGLKTDNSEYVLGTALKLSGKVMDYDHQVTNNMRNSVEVKILDPNGNPITYFDHNQKTGYTNCNTNDCTKYEKPLIYTATPDTVGNFQLDVVLLPIQFEYGTYTIKATHSYSKTTESLEFKIKSAQDDIIPKIDSTEPITLTLCSSDRVHVDEILKDMRSIGKGENLPSMESIDCTNNNSYTVGQKMVVSGKVIPKNPTSLDQSSTKTSGQTQGGHSYSTNYAESIMNYVLVSIPYPKSMTVSGAASVQTIPDDNENYTGGGGSGEGGSYFKDKEGNTIRPDTNCEVSAVGECTPTKRSDRQGEGSYNGKVVLKNQKLLLTNMNFKAYPDAEGNFVGVFELRPGVFNSGTYSVKAEYFGHQTEELAIIKDKSMKGGLEPRTILELEKEQFTVGDTVKIKGKIENIYYFDSVSAVVEHSDQSKLNCLTMDCGYGNSAKKLRVNEGVNGPEFFWNYHLSSDSPLGLYTITVATHFGESKKQFFVVSDSDIVEQSESPFSTKKIIDKFNRISDNQIPITLGEKSSEESTLMPRVLQGSLFTSARGEESDVNLRVSTSDGQCIIGQDSNCLVSESTRKPGEIYSIVSIDDENYKIRYSGNDVRLEKFSIVPEESNSQIDVNNWKVEVIKDEQPTRFYYKVSYIALE